MTDKRPAGPDEEELRWLRQLADLPPRSVLLPRGPGRYLDMTSYEGDSPLPPLPSVPEREGDQGGGESTTPAE